MEDLIKILESFNRKERYFLLTRTLDICSKEGEPAFRLNKDFREKIIRKLGLSKWGVKEESFVAMDYHLDWIAASLFLSCGGLSANRPFENWEKENGDQHAVIEGGNRDIDLLIAFQCDSDVTYHLVMVEAKAYTGWENEQFEEKTTRLKQIFGVDGQKYPNVNPYLCLMGPKESVGLKTDNLPGWMKPNGKVIWLNMQLPDSRTIVERCDQDGRALKIGGYFHCPTV